MAELWDILDKLGNKTGRLHERGKDMQPNDYHLIVEVWIRNSAGEFLLSKRAPDRGDCWHTTCGCAITGDDSLSAAVREAQEELGVTLAPSEGRFFKRKVEPKRSGPGNVIVDTWLFCQEVDISKLTLCPVEISDAMWISKQELIKMSNDGINCQYNYLEDFFNFCDL